jgi:hypothetical protein
MQKQRAQLLKLCSVRSEASFFRLEIIQEVNSLQRPVFQYEEVGVPKWDTGYLDQVHRVTRSSHSGPACENTSVDLVSLPGGPRLAREELLGAVSFSDEPPFVHLPE